MNTSQKDIAIREYIHGMHTTSDGLIRSIANCIYGIGLGCGEKEIERECAMVLGERSNWKWSAFK